jgi:Holliday junction resolvase RusA-like endonuclease
MLTGIVCAECAKRLAGGEGYIFSTRPLLPVEGRLYGIGEGLEGRTVRITIPGAPATKKNHNRLVRLPNGAVRPVPSKPFMAFQKRAAAHCPELGIGYPVNVKATYYMPKRGVVDIANLHSALHDVLVKHGTLEDDSCRIVVSTDGSRVRYSKEDPRVEVEITPAGDDGAMCAAEMTPPQKAPKKKK